MERVPLTRAAASITTSASPVPARNTPVVRAYQTFGGPKTKEKRIPAREERARLLRRLDLLDNTGVSQPIMLDIVYDHNDGHFAIILNRNELFATYASVVDLAPPVVIDQTRIANDLRDEDSIMRILYAVLDACDRKPHFTYYFSLEHKRLTRRRSRSVMGLTEKVVPVERDITCYVLVYNRLETKRRLRLAAHPSLQLPVASPATPPPFASIFVSQHQQQQEEGGNYDSDEDYDDGVDDDDDDSRSGEDEDAVGGSDGKHAYIRRVEVVAPKRKAAQATHKKK